MDQRLEIDLTFGLERQADAQRILEGRLQQKIRQSTHHEDVLTATDLVTQSGDCIGVRLRDYFKYACYTHEFTIRSGRPNGHKTELEKILSGCGDYLFYGFYTDTIVEWRLVDLSVFREHYQPGKLKHNPGETSFHVFRYLDFPSSMVTHKYIPSLTEQLTIHTTKTRIEQSVSQSLLSRFHDHLQNTQQRH